MCGIDYRMLIGSFLIDKFRCSGSIQRKENSMAIYKEAVCIHYIALGQCKKGREACHERYCQKCDKYYPRAKVKQTNRKKNENKKNYKLSDIRDFRKHVD